MMLTPSRFGRLLAIGCIAVAAAACSASTGSGHIDDAEAIQRVEDAYSDCFATIGASTDGATVEHVAKANPKGRYLSRVILSDGAEFTVNAFDTGAAPTNDQAISDLDAAGC